MSAMLRLLSLTLIVVFSHAFVAHSVLAQVTTKAISEGAISGDLYIPAKVPAPAVFVLHSAYGKVHTADRNMAKALAEAGFVAFAINYPLNGPPTWIAPYLAWMKARPEAAGQPLGAVGFSAGGARVFYFATRDPQVKAIVSYYGTYDYATSPLAGLRARPEAGPIRLVDKISAATLMLNGGRDNEVPVEQVERMKQALLARGLPAEAVIYPNAYHSFDRGPEGNGSDRTSNGSIVAYDGAAAADAQARTIAWFRTYLK